MSLWFATPSARPIEHAARCFAAWRALGFKTAATRKDGTDGPNIGLDLTLSLDRYQGYYAHNNLLARAILERDPSCAAVIVGGDDVHPDPNWQPEVLERQFVEHFGGTLGVCQGTGGNEWSRKRDASGRRNVERIAWAPMMGRDWCLRAYGGRGPMWAEYNHYYGDESLQVVAEKLGLFWQRADWAIDHRNWKTHENGRPVFLEKAKALWDSDKAIFEKRQAAGFPGHELAERQCAA